jgi:prolyl-tRNA synthetase
LRTAEFFMARRAYCSCKKVEAVEESEKMMNVYADFAKTSWHSGCKGIKTETERFVGRGNILYRSINAGRKSQAGTSHYLGQNFAKALMLSLLMQGKQEYVWGTFGVSTRLWVL